MSNLNDDIYINHIRECKKLLKNGIITEYEFECIEEKLNKQRNDNNKNDTKNT